MKFIIFVIMILGFSPTFAQSEVDCSGDAGFKNKQELTKFTESLKSANSVETLSSLISYPLRINEGSKKHFLIKNESELKVHFKKVFPEETLKVIHEQDPKITFCNYQGLTIGGVIWINKKNGKPGIYVVNMRAK